MTCDMTCPDDCTDVCPPLCENPAISRAIDHCVSVLADLDKNIPEDTDMELVAVSINAEMLILICTALLDYAEFDGVDTDELFLMANAISANVSSYSPTTRH